MKRELVRELPRALDEHLLADPFGLRLHLDARKQHAVVGQESQESR